MKKIFFSVFVFILSSLIITPTFAGESNPADFRATVSYAVDAGAGIAVSWIPENGITYELHRFKEGDNKIDKNIQINAVTGNPYIYIDENIRMNAKYFYRLINKRTDAVIAQTESINLQPMSGGILKSTAWGGWASNTETPYGIGWISGDSSSIPGSKTRYGVFVDSAGLLHGTMWAGHTNNNGYGWLSFNKEDLNGCPSGTCEARVDGSGKISGWARFTNAKDSTGLWSGWVSLRGMTGSEKKYYGVCFGAAKSEEVIIGPQKTVYYTGATCAGDGARNSTLNGVGWASDTIGGWIVFGNAKSLAGGNALTISPAPPHRVAIRDHKSFSANLDVKWYIDNKLGGDGLGGTVTPNQSTANTKVSYRGPDALPNIPQVRLSASTTDPLNPRNAETEITILPPYGLGCAAEGDTSIRVFINKNYFDVNYQTENRHQAELFVGTAVGSEPNTFVTETKGPEYVHARLQENTTYFYQLRTTYESPNYRIKTQTVSCKTGETIPIGSATTLSAFSNSPSRIYLNWKDNSRSLAPYEFEVQRMQLTPSTLFEPKFEPQSNTSVLVKWAQKTDSTPYEQKLMRSENSGADWEIINTTQWNNKLPPTDPTQFSYEDIDVALGRTYQYKLEVCSLVVLDGTMYSRPIKGGVGKPSRVCVTSEVAQYMHKANIGQNNTFIQLTASILSSADSVAKKVSRSVFGILDTISQSVSETYISFTNIFRKEKINIARGATPSGDYDAYFKSVARTKNPALVDDLLSADSLYVYRVSIFAENPQWSNLRAAKTMTDEGGGSIENRPICMRNSFCDSSISGVRNSLDTESSEQQCLVNKDCVNIGRSDQGYIER